MFVPRVLVSTVGNGDRRVTLPADEAHHLTRVLRVAVGDAVRVFDGRGREWAGRLIAIGRHSASVDLDEEVRAVPEPRIRVTIAVGLLKGDQMDHAVRDATMMGAAAIAPMVTQHSSVPGQAWKSGAAVERWRRVAVACAKQCGRATIPEIADVRAFADVLAAHTDEMMFLCAIAGDVQPSTAPAPPSGRAIVFVGPEGGWAAQEAVDAHAAGAVALHLGPRTIRAESAPIVALTALWATWGW